MPKAHLDHAFCLNARCEEGKRKTDFYDDAVTGFVFECRSTGGRTFYLRYSDAGGRLKQHKIGRYEDVSVAQARKVAQRLRSEVVMGGDPGARRAEARAVPLYAELAAQHVEHARTYIKSIKTFRGLHDTDCRSLGELPPDRHPPAGHRDVAFAAPTAGLGPSDG